MFKLILLILSVAACSNQLSAQEKQTLYKWVDEKGNIHFSDEPHPGAQEIEMKQVPAIKIEKMHSSIGTPANLSDDDGFEENQEKQEYQLVEFSEPLNKGVVRNNASAVTLSANVTPSLFEGHKVEFYLDGQLVSADNEAQETTENDDIVDAGALSAVATGVEYGEHYAKFVIVDSSGKQVATSNSITFHLLHLNNQKIRANKKNN